MNHEENASESQWPREVCITQTHDAIAAELGDDYDEDDDNGLVVTAMMDSTYTLEIASWDEIPKGYEPVDPDEKEAYHLHSEAKQQIHAEEPPQASPPPRPSGTLTAVELKCGKSYDCTMDGDLGPEDCRFVQLAIDANSNRRFMLMGAKHLFSKNLAFIHNLTSMSYKELAAEDFDGNPERPRGLQLWPFVLDENGTLTAESQECYLCDFTETDAIKPVPEAQ